MKRSLIVKFIAAIVVIAGLIIASKYLGFGEFVKVGFENSLRWIDGLGYWGFIAFALIYIVATVFLLPGSILTLGAGFLFGLFKGSILVSLASTLGATAAFLVGRYFLRGWVARLIEQQPKFKAIDEAIAKEGWKIVGLTRLSPVFPFVFLNYAFGVTKVPLPHYVIASWIGMMPGTVMYVYFGSLAKDLASLGTGNESGGILPWVLRITGFIATVVVTVFITKIAKKALDSEIESGQQSPVLSDKSSS